MKRLATLFILLSMVATLTGCFKERVILNTQYDTSKTTPDHSVTQIWIIGLVNVSGDNNLENLKAADDTWKVRLIEEDFHRLMFDTEGL